VAEISFLGVPDISGWTFLALTAGAFLGTFVGVVTGAAGGLMVLAFLALVFPPAVLVPVHTFVQLGASSSIAIIMRQYILRATILPFLVGAVTGAVLGAQIFVSLPEAALQGIIGGFILLLAWIPKLAAAGKVKNRFAVLGFVATFVGMFVSATGTLVAPFVINASPDRRNHAATMGALMCMSHISKIVAFGALGIGVGAYAPLIVAMIAACACASWLGGKTLNRIPEKLFRIVFQILLTGLALRLLWVAARGSGLF